MGTQQSGVLNLQIADLVKDRDILQIARHIAIRVLKRRSKHEQTRTFKMKDVFIELTKKKNIWNYIS